MYPVFGNGNDFVSHEGQLVGFTFGSDASTEHECGIAPLRAAFGVKGQGYGIDRHMVTSKPLLDWHEDGDEAILAFNVHATETLLSTELRFRDWEKNPSVVGAWSNASFVIRVKGQEHIAYLREIRDAFARKDIALVMGHRGVLMPGAVNLFIASRFPADENVKWVAEHKERDRVNKLWADSGVEQELRTAGLKWFALSNPRIIQGELRVWLNPYEQRIHNAGWFTVEQLRQWAKGEGPVMMKQKAG